MASRSRHSVAVDRCAAGGGGSRLARAARAGGRALALTLTLGAGLAAAETKPETPLPIERICSLIEANAAEHGMLPEFFARLIYKESRFDAKALSPVGAQGIAQFMPATAKERGLADPWDPEQAIPASASYLADLRREFGNWGLAAAAYNGGPHRVSRFLTRGARLPLETVDYVASITYRSVEWFRAKGREVERRPLAKDKTFAEACAAMPILPTRAVFASTKMPWGVQIAGGRSHRVAANAAKRVKRQYARVLGGKSVRIHRSRRGIRGALYQARVGARSRKEAGQICARLRKAGGTCVVLRN